MEIVNFKSNYCECFLMFDGSHYAVFNNYHGLIACTDKIERNADYTSANINIVIPDLLPIAKQAITKNIIALENRFIKKDITITYQVETAHAGRTGLNDSYMYIGIKNR